VNFQKLLSAVLLGVALRIILSDSYSPDTTKWAIGLVGTMIGYWFMFVPIRNNIIFADETAIIGSRFGRHHTRMRTPPPEGHGRRGQGLAD
jgi:hypothetical protein